MATPMKQVHVYFKNPANGMQQDVHDNPLVNTTKLGFYVVETQDHVFKYPMCSIIKVTEFKETSTGVDTPASV